MQDILGLLFLIAGASGVLYQCLKFVKETLPANYGDNPGFGALEVMVLPWFAVAGIGLGLFVKSWVWGVALFVSALFCSGFLAMLLARFFGGKRN